MKYLFTISIGLLMIVSCKKQEAQQLTDYLSVVKQNLQDSLSATDFANLQFSLSAFSKVDSVDLYLLRVPFVSKNPFNDFILIQTDKSGHIQRGRVVHLQGQVSAKEGGGKNFDGKITVQTLRRQTLIESPIQNGFITAFHTNPLARGNSLEPGLMPEVIITYVLPHNGGGISWSAWMQVQTFFQDSGGSGGGGGGWGNYYLLTANTDNGGGSGGSTGMPWGNQLPYWITQQPLPSGGMAYVEEFLEVDFETQDQQAAIEIQKFINCFNAIPDAGATCSIEIFADIPVDSDPNKIFNFQTKSPGHTFLNIRKGNGSQSVSQNIGFYPANGLKTIITNAPIDGKFVDNSFHEFNCGFKINITPAALTAAFMEMLRAKDSKYDIDNYNCTDWALNVFNAAGGNLTIPLYDIPGTAPSTGTRMPNGVYHKLRQMKTSNDPRSSGITIDIVKGFAGTSTGACN